MFAMRRLNRSFSRRLQIDRQQREKPLAVESWLARRAQIRTMKRYGTFHATTRP